MKTHNIANYTDGWYRARLGIPTSSDFDKIITPLGKPTDSKARTGFMYRLIAERLLQQYLRDMGDSYWTRRGRELEAQAVDAFIMRTGMKNLVSGGFFTTDDGRAGSSPDRWVLTGKKKKANIREAIEVKCPAPWTHVEYLLEGPGRNYKPQVQGQMLIGEFDAVHFWSYHPQMPPLHFVSVRDDLYIETLRKELTIFCNDLDAEEERARKLGPFKLSETLRLVLEHETMETPGAFPWMTS